MRPLAIAAPLFALVLLLSMPASPWEFDEPLFFQALHRYDPVAHHPPPPGYPVFIGVGQAVRMLIPSDFHALRTISVLSSLIAFLMLALAFRNLSGDALTGVTGAVVFYFSPAMLVHATLPISEPGALALLATSFYLGTRRSAPASMAAFAALSVGWRIQFAIFVVPFFLTSVFFLKRWRDRAIALVTFTLVCLAWLVPLAIAVGGFDELVKFQTGQGRYLAAHDAAQSRSGWTAGMIAVRFVAHPWGVKLASFPLLVAAAAGVVLAIASRRRGIVPLAVAAALYLAFALRYMDPADGVRYAIPSLPVVACFAAMGAVAAARRFSIPSWVMPLLFSAGSVVYTSSLLVQRATGPSPPVQAAEFARGSQPANAVALYELPLWPHAMYYLAAFQPQRVDQGLARFYDRPDVPLFVYADGASREADAATFRWAPSDAYSKLTRNHYRVVSIIPIPPERRFRPVRGVLSPEREPEGLAWRWLAEEAELQLPNGGARRVDVHLTLPADSPVESNEVTVAVEGTPAGSWRVDRGVVTVAEIDVAEGAPMLTLSAARSFVPAEIPGGLSRDPRRLSVKLLGISTRSTDAPAAPRAASQ